MRPLLFALCAAVLVSCSAQVHREPSGEVTANINVFSAGTLHRKPGGEMLMSGTSEKAGDHFTKHLTRGLMIGLAGQGIEAMKDVGVKALNP